jgi:hypothetical protein
VDYQILNLSVKTFNLLETPIGAIGLGILGFTQKYNTPSGAIPRGYERLLGKQYFTGYRLATSYKLLEKTSLHLSEEFKQLEQESSIYYESIRGLPILEGSSQMSEYQETSFIKSGLY